MNDHFRNALESLDVDLVRKIWSHVMPHLPQPSNEREALIVMHMARTGSRSIRFRDRAYSHAWLTERSIPSNLPDKLRPRAERMYPRSVDGVGIAVRNVTPIALKIRRAMEEAVLDSGVANPILTKRAILAARAKIRKRLLGLNEGE
jgi:hypothetical protein